MAQVSDAGSVSGVRGARLEITGGRCVLMLEARETADILGFALEARWMWWRVSCISGNKRIRMQNLSFYYTINLSY